MLSYSYKHFSSETFTDTIINYCGIENQRCCIHLHCSVALLWETWKASEEAVSAKRPCHTFLPTQLLVLPSCHKTSSPWKVIPKLCGAKLIWPFEYTENKADVTEPCSCFLPAVTSVCLTKLPETWRNECEDRSGNLFSFLATSANHTWSIVIHSWPTRNESTLVKCNISWTIPPCTCPTGVTLSLILLPCSHQILQLWKEDQPSNKISAPVQTLLTSLKSHISM